MMAGHYKKPTIIIASGGLSKEIIDTLLESEDTHELIGVIDEYKKNGDPFHGSEIIGSIIDIPDIAKKIKNLYFHIAIGDNFTRSKVYKEIINLNIKNLIPLTIIDSSAVIKKSVTVGFGCYIAAGTIIQSSTKIGNFSIINLNTSIDHDNSIDDFCSLAGNSITGGNVKIGKFTHLALATVVKNNIEIEENVIVGSNSYVSKNLTKNNIYFGNPAKLYKQRILGEKYL
jgi:sugar O-acyltransferase (sialic acid O-acetyltransferase NeuD family)